MNIKKHETLIEKILTESKMKLVDKILLEGKQRGTLYHYTNFQNLFGILETNKLNPSSFYNPKGNSFRGVSTTRDKEFHNTSERIDEGIEGVSVRFELNGNKLSDKYKIMPFNYYYLNAKSGDVEDLKATPTRHKGTESEEVILTKSSIENIKAYIHNISFFPEKEKNNYYGKQLPILLDLVSEKNIPFWIDDVWEDTIEDLRNEIE